PLGKSRLIYSSTSSDDDCVVIYAIGFSAYIAKVAAEEFVRDNPNSKIKVYDARFIKPLDNELILKEVKRARSFISVEENVLAGGFGSAVLECIIDANKTCEVPFYRLGIEDRFIDHGTQAELRSEANIDVKAVYEEIKKAIGKEIWVQRPQNQSQIHH
ncbi:MAG: transketolase C-terminal domain-containing protein, partial [bacterium]